MNSSETLDTLPAAEPTNFQLSRFNLMLIGAVVIQLVLALIVFAPRFTTTTTPTASPLLGELDVEQLTRISLTSSDGQEVSLENTDAGWVLADTDGYPVLAAKVPELVDMLKKITTDRLVTSTADSHKRLEVAENQFQRKITLETYGGSQTLYIGSSPNVNATNVRLEGQDETYLARDVTVFQMNADPTNWIEPVYFSLPADEIKAITVQNERGELDFTKDAAGNWTMAGVGEDEELLPNNITSLATQISTLRLAEPIGKEAKPEFGLDQPLATVTVTAQKEGEAPTTYTLTMGAKDPEADRYVVKASNSDYYVWVSGFSLEKFQRTRTDYLAQPEDAPPVPDGTGPDAAPSN